MSLASSQNKRKRAPAACTLCRKRHVRCTWSLSDMPTPCKRCCERKLKCIYEPTASSMAQSVSPVMHHAIPTAPSVHSPLPGAAVPHRPRASSDSVWYSSSAPSYPILPEQDMGKSEPPTAWYYANSLITPPPSRLSSVNNSSYNHLHYPYARPENLSRSPLHTTHISSYDPSLAVSQVGIVYQSSPVDTQWFGSPYSGTGRSSFGADPYHSHSHSPVQFNDGTIGLDPPSRI